jgi:hypothetical protein
MLGPARVGQGALPIVGPAPGVCLSRVGVAHQDETHGDYYAINLASGIGDMARGTFDASATAVDVVCSTPVGLYYIVGAPVPPADSISHALSFAIPAPYVAVRAGEPCPGPVSGRRA